MAEKVSLPARSQPKSGRQEASHELRSKQTPRCAPVLGGSLGRGVWTGAGLTETSPLCSVAAEHKQAWGLRGYEDLREALPCPGAPGGYWRASRISHAQRKTGGQVVSSASSRSTIPRLHNGHPEQGLGVRPKAEAGCLEQSPAPPLRSDGTCQGC